MMASVALLIKLLIIKLDAIIIINKKNNNIIILKFILHKK